jgi:hypothetical protein
MKEESDNDNQLIHRAPAASAMTRVAAACEN